MTISPILVLQKFSASPWVEGHLTSFLPYSKLVELCLETVCSSEEVNILFAALSSAKK